MQNRIQELEEIARQIRIDILTMIYKAGDGHPGASLSVTDLITALYFEVMNIDPANPQKPDRDRFILSKGHACPALYAALARRGFFSRDELPGLRSLNSMLQGHPDMNKTPGIDSTSGSLGNGISIGLGMVLAARLTGYDYYTYVITGDGELQEGVVWEAATAAAKYKAGRLIVLVDNNGLQSSGPVEEVSGLYPILPKWEAFGWHCQEIDGHSFEQILPALQKARDCTDRPSLILAHTVKGCGVPFMIGDNSWHKRVPTAEEYQQAMRILGGPCS
ncbi:MAG TPA: transketolase [Anaerohalosphaeraceae bacterium]|nr:transketolase [Anaerohalosphaeraceae bacterium]HPP55063.1 transketolase [Anaerohalosphaeraceae bacterium]